MMYDGYYRSHISDYEAHQKFHKSRFPGICTYCDSELRQKWREEQDRINNKPIPNCEYCNEAPVYGDERNAWLGAHNAWWHRLHYAIKRFFLI